jgi:hypothetical protein
VGSNLAPCPNPGPDLSSAASIAAPSIAVEHPSYDIFYPGSRYY